MFTEIQDKQDIQIQKSQRNCNSIFPFLTFLTLKTTTLSRSEHRSTGTRALSPSEASEELDGDIFPVAAPCPASSVTLNAPPWHPSWMVSRAMNISRKGDPCTLAPAGRSAPSRSWAGAFKRGDADEGRLNARLSCCTDGASDSEASASHSTAAVRSISVTQRGGRQCRKQPHCKTHHLCWLNPAHATKSLS